MKFQLNSVELIQIYLINNNKKGKPNHNQTNLLTNLKSLVCLNPPWLKLDGFLAETFQSMLSSAAVITPASSA